MMDTVPAIGSRKEASPRTDCFSKASAHHMTGQIFAGLSERAGAPLDERDAKLALEIGDVLRNRGLADAEFARRIRKRFAANEGAVGTQSGIKLHNYSLYHPHLLCILNFTGS